MLRLLWHRQKHFVCVPRLICESVVTFGLICWWGNLSVKSREKINRIYTISCKIAGCCTPDTSLEQLYKSRTLQMATKILSDPTHFLHDHYELLPSGRRYKMPTVKTQRALKSFIPSSIKYLKQPRKIDHWTTFHSPYHCHCNVVLSHLFIYLIILSYWFLAFLFQYLIYFYSYGLHVYILYFTV